MLHRPPHLLINETWYFISAHTAGKLPLLCSDEHKSIWCGVFESLQGRFNVRIAAWVLLDNHLNQFDAARGRDVWYSYWDHCVRDERDFWTKFNYIHYNPVKHGYAGKPDDWKNSSYREILGKRGEDWMDDCWAGYPVVEYDFEG